ncbi:MAG: DUF4159 domain-containing protein [Tepidisphaeraceae bacterium]
MVLGRIVHNGDWDPTPHGLPNLLKTIAQDTTLHVQFRRMPVDLGKDDIFSFPVLYMTGQRKFQLTDAVRTRLRKYLDNGGTMLVDCAVGSSEFDKAFRDEIKLIYPDRQLKALPPEHALFTFISDTRHVEMAPLAKKLFGGVTNPRLEAIDTDGTLSVIYSRFSLSAGWERLPHAYNIGYADDDALKLGVNLLMYVVSH